MSANRTSDDKRGNAFYTADRTLLPGGAHIREQVARLRRCKKGIKVSPPTDHRTSYHSFVLVARHRRAPGNGEPSAERVSQAAQERSSAKRFAKQGTFRPLRRYSSQCS